MKSNKFTKQNPPEGFYVYLYLREDYTPYYVGKGKGDRAWVEHRDTRNNRGIWTPKDNNRIVIIAYDVSNEWALITERRYIRWFGRKDNGTGILRNKTDGGDGLVNPSQEIKDRISSKSGRPQKKGAEAQNYRKFACRNTVTGETFLADSDEPMYREYPYEAAAKGKGVGTKKPGTSAALLGVKKSDVVKEKTSGKKNGRYDPTVIDFTNVYTDNTVSMPRWDFSQWSGLPYVTVTALATGQMQISLKSGWKRSDVVITGKSLTKLRRILKDK